MSDPSSSSSRQVNGRFAKVHGRRDPAPGSDVRPLAELASIGATRLPSDTDAMRIELQHHPRPLGHALHDRRPDRLPPCRESGARIDGGLAET